MGKPVRSGSSAIDRKRPIAEVQLSRSRPMTAIRGDALDDSNDAGTEAAWASMIHALGVVAQTRPDKWYQVIGSAPPNSHMEAPLALSPAGMASQPPASGSTIWRAAHTASGMSIRTR